MHTNINGKLSERSRWKLVVLTALLTPVLNAQSFRFQCPVSTTSHRFSNLRSLTGDNNWELACTGRNSVASTVSADPFINGQQYPKDDYLELVVGSQNGAIRYQEISGDDGSSTRRTASREVIQNVMILLFYLREYLACPVKANLSRSIDTFEQWVIDQHQE